MLLGNKKECINGIWNNMDEPQNNYTWWKKQGKKEYMLYDSAL